MSQKYVTHALTFRSRNISFLVFSCERRSRWVFEFKVFFFLLAVGGEEALLASEVVHISIMQHSTAAHFYHRVEFSV